MGEEKSDTEKSVISVNFFALTIYTLGVRPLMWLNASLFFSFGQVAIV